ncbi:A24 family peptidase (plasmid) [Paraburkholderia sprentiae WSM5005]|uniref:A24 family peptidase n=1 Tax=Paraburkholderia sprentiae WSM5005 TaxID=754502 RepID=A0ACA8AX48_9BURK|nr:A24 family peptidase [Paraburkholderia sprentiae]APA90295.1 A24 family peptidase [Paraburkholderia sprentiae WSM5005]
MMSTQLLGSAAALGACAGSCLPSIARTATQVALLSDGADESECEAVAMLFRGCWTPAFVAGVAALSVASVAIEGCTIRGVALTGFLLVLAVLAAIDFATMLLPDVLTIPLTVAGIVVNAWAVVVPLQDAALGATIGFFAFGCLYWAVRFVCGREGMGFGDVKLACALGAWLGYQALPHIVAAALILAGLYACALVIARKVDDDRFIPFGPFLAAGAALSGLLGTPLYALAMQA